MSDRANTVVDLFEQVYHISFVFFIGVWHEDVKLTLIFVHVTATVSPIPSTIPTGPPNVVDSTSVAVAAAVPTAVVVAAGITALFHYIYVHSYSRICLSIHHCTVHAYISSYYSSSFCCACEVERQEKYDSCHFNNVL